MLKDVDLDVKTPLCRAPKAWEAFFYAVVNVFWFPEIVVDDWSQVAEFIDDWYEAPFL